MLKAISAALAVGFTLFLAPVASAEEDGPAKVAKTAHHNGTTLKEEALRLGFVSADEFDRLVQPEKMTRPG